MIKKIKILRCRNKPIYFSQCFTLIELLTVIAIIGILAGLMLPGMHEAKRRAKLARWRVFVNNLRADPALMAQWTFEDLEKSDTLVNTAFGINDFGYNQKSYYGVYPDTVALSKRGGRWGKNALYFPGNTGDVVKILDDGYFHIDSGAKYVSAVVWFKTDGFTTTQGLISERSSLSDIQSGWSFKLDGDGLILWVNNDKNKAKHCYTDSSRWHMATFTLDFEKSKFKIYADNKLVKSDVLPGSISTKHTKLSQIGLRIGSNQPESNMFKGFIDEVELFKKVLTDNEIKAMYEVGQE